MRKHTVFAFLAMMLGICIMTYAGIQWSEAKQIYQEGDTIYDDLSDRVKKSTASDFRAHSASAGASAPKVYIPEQEIDFEVLRTINKDAAAWLYSPDTVIDYPIMKADDYSYYLNHLPDRTANANGSLFIDYNNASDFSDPLTVIYGHYMKSGRMFGSLKGYKDQRYYDAHPYMYLYTEEQNYRIDLLYGCLIGAGQWREQAFMYSVNAESLLAYAAYNTTFESGIEYEKGDRLIAMSTCSYEFDDARYVVIGILRSEY